ncbi:hypothetical protein ACWGTO_32760 [Mesorhizobium sp. PL10]
MSTGPCSISTTAEFDIDPPPVAVIFLQPRPRDFIELRPPPTPVDVFALPTLTFVPVPEPG